MMGLYLALVLMTLVTSNVVLGEMGDILKLLDNLRENEERRQMVSQLTENELASRSMSSLLDAIFKRTTCGTEGAACGYSYDCCSDLSCLDSTAETRPDECESNADKCCKGSS